MTTMDFSATLAALRRLRVETESLACLGCGHEHNCSTHGCAILRNTVEYMEAALENYDNLSALVDRLETELKSEILSAAELRYRLANEWVSVEERLPESTECWETYIVTVNRSHWPTSSYDLCDAPYNEELVAVAQYDSKQKIWHLSWDEQLNALIQADDAPLNGDFVTHWMPLPEPSGKEG